jgi:RNA polymerase sigma factor (sigma-70 family)
MGSMSRQSVSAWIDDLKAGEHEAARKLWERYFEKLVNLARRELGSKSRRREADEEDVAQRVFKSLWQGAEAGRFPKLTDRNDLWALMIKLTEHKVIDQLRYEGRQKRGGGKVRGESALFDVNQERPERGIEQIAGQEPTPEFLMQMNEQCDRLLGLLPDDTLRDVAIWKLQRYTDTEIAEKLDCVVRTVERKLKLIRSRWSKELGP